MGFWLTRRMRDLMTRIRTIRFSSSTKDYLDNIIRTMGDMLIVIGPDGTIEMVNPATLETLGYEETELLHQPLERIFVQQTAGRRGIETLVERGFSRHAEKLLRARDGRLVPVLFSGRVMYSGPNGARVVCVAQDITALKAAQARLTENENRHRIISELSSDYAFSAHIGSDDAPVIDWVFGGFQHITGFRPEEIGSYQMWLRLVHPADRKLYADTVRHVAETGKNDEHTFRIIARSGAVRHLRVRYHPVRDAESGKVTRVYGAVEDVTDRKAADMLALEAALHEERVRLLADFIRDVSHDVRTPLTAISTSIYLLRRLDEDPEKRAEHYSRIEQQTMRLEELLDGMLTLARLDRETDFEFRSVNLNAALQAVSARIAPLLEARHITLIEDLDAELPLVQADKDELHRALLNLLGNAVRFTPEMGSVTLRTRVRDGKAVIEVQDTGIGIDSADLARIFQRFYRADQARSSDTGGSGLGLAITKKIIERHGGVIDVESHPGEGSLFRILLPLGFASPLSCDPSVERNETTLSQQTGAPEL